MQYLRIGPTPCVSSSHPFSVSKGSRNFDLHELPRVSRRFELDPFMPEMDVIGIHK